MATGISNIYVGTAAWNLPKHVRDRFPETGSVLEKYATRFKGVEINSSFYRDHQGKTYARWGDCVPEDFRFAVKLSKLFTHVQKLQLDGVSLGPVLSDVLLLGAKLSVLLVQLPPSLKFDRDVAVRFFDELRSHYTKAVAFEPRHESWNSPEAMDLTEHFRLARVWADPEPIANATLSPAASDFIYYRLHGTPEIYKSDYTPEAIESYAKKLLGASNGAKEVWCIFDNTTFGHATTNALALQEILASHEIQQC